MFLSEQTSQFAAKILIFIKFDPSENKYHNKILLLENKVELLFNEYFSKYKDQENISLKNRLIEYFKEIINCKEENMK